MTSLYACTGPRLTRYDIDVDAGLIEERESIDLPADGSYAWPHASGKYLYAATSDTLPKRRNPGVPAGSDHRLIALKVGDDGVLSEHGASVRLPTRAVHVSTDVDSRHVLVAFNRPSDLRVYAIEEDGSLGAEQPQERPLDAGIFAHQVRVTPDNRLAMLVTRGNDPENGKPEEPGALKVFEYDDGRLGGCATVAPGGGFGFGPRHLDFHPRKPWVYVALERQNELAMFRRHGDTWGSEPLFVKETLLNPDHVRPRQLAGTVHVHPRGAVVYVANRAYTPDEIDGRSVLSGGENNIAVFRIDPCTGEPRAVQHVDTGGVYARTFHVHPSGRLLVTANLMPLDVLENGVVRAVPASLGVFRIDDGGKLDHLRTYEVDVRDKSLYWIGIF
ncbi:putative 6-phosphogluconolactonase-like enzyme [metagenome]|uniref:Putative 6-phosphogluconolactonase-like enzyme n=1 Tax=metagenome TaxID=256318 RepID=A0A2P2C8S4_9ZZZZ